jgi:hypothetical protein
VTADLNQTTLIPKPAKGIGKRVGSIDVFRGFVMLLMMSEVLNVEDVAKALPGNRFWVFINCQQSHVGWIG